MRERPILFSAPMVRAILEGRKSQTRRVVKPEPPDGLGMYACLGAWRCEGVDYRANEVETCPYGAPGARLWVRETWADLTATHGRPYERWNDTTGLYERGTEPFIWYRADGEQPDTGNGAAKYAPWRPSIHMPRAASRITLEITGVRVERLQDISEADAIAEGIEGPGPGVVLPGPFDADRGGQPGYSVLGMGTFPTAVSAYRVLWEVINGAGSWDADPWVWVVEFRRIGDGRAAA